MRIFISFVFSHICIIASDSRKKENQIYQWDEPILTWLL